MHIVDVTMFFAKEGGGVRRYLTSKHQWLRDKNHLRHSLVVPGRRDGPAADPNVFQFACPPLPFASGYRLPLLTGSAEDALRLLSPDLLEAGDPYTLAWSALRVGQELGVPVVGFYHSDLPRMLEMRFGRPGVRAGEVYVRHLYPRFDLVLAPSQTMVNRLQDLGIASARHQPLGVDTDTFSPPPHREDIRARLGLSPKTRLLVYVGRFSREKNLPLLFQAMEELGRDFHLIVVGGGGRVPRASNISQARYIANPKRLARLMGSCDALVHAGDKETFGLAVLEAMSCGLPVVGMNRGGVGELLQEGWGIAVEPGSPVRFARGIRDLFGQDVRQLGQQAREQVVNRYSWNRVMPQLLEHYYSLRPAKTPRTGPALHPVRAGD